MPSRGEDAPCGVILEHAEPERAVQTVTHGVVRTAASARIISAAPYSGGFFRVRASKCRPMQNLSPEFD